MANVIWRGDCQPRPQVDTITPANVEVGDIFTVTINRKDISVTATAATVANVVGKLVTAIGTYSNAISEFKEVSASAGSVVSGGVTIPSTHVIVTGPKNGMPFTITSSTTEGGITLTIVEEQKGDPGKNEIQRVAIPAGCTAGTFTLTFNGQTTGAIAYNASAATVQAALEALSNLGVGDPVTTGNAGGPWTVEFKAAYANQDVPLMTGDGSLLVKPAGSYTVHIATTTDGVNCVNEIQRVSLAGPPTGGTFTLTFDGQTTAATAYNASAATVQANLEALSNIAVGDVTVTGSAGVWDVEFKGVYKGTNVSLMTGSGASLTGGAYGTVQTTTDGYPSKNVIYRIGSLFTGRPFILKIFALNLGIVQERHTTANLTEASTAAQVKQAIIAAIPATGTVIHDSDLVVTSNSFGNWYVEWTGNFAAHTSNDIQMSTPATGEVTVDVYQEGDATGANEVEVVTLYNGPTGGTFTLSFRGTATAGIAYNASAATVQTALQAIGTIGAGNATVAGNAGGPWTVTFTGTLASIDVGEMTISTASITGSSVFVSTTQNSVIGVDEIQQIYLTGSPTGGTFTLSFEGNTTAAIAWNASTDSLQTAFSALATIGAGQCSVSGAAGGPWNVEFTGTRKWENVVLITGSAASLSGGAVDVSTTQASVPIKDEIQGVSITSATSGTFTLTYGGNTTAAIPRYASAGSVQSCLEALASIGSGKVVVTGAAGGTWHVEFIGTLGGADLVLMTGDATLLTGTGTQTLVTAITVVGTGPSNLNDAENYTTNTLPVNGDVFIVDDAAAADILWNLDALSGVTLAKLVVRQSFEGKKIGLSDHNGDYYEYRPTELAIGATSIEIGNGTGNGPKLVRINTAAVATAIEVLNSGRAEDANERAVMWRGTNAANTAEILGGQFGCAMGQAEIATLLTLRILKNGDSTPPNVFCGIGVTLGTVEIDGGDVILNSLIGTSLTVNDGVVIVRGLGAVTQLYVLGGTMFYNTSGNLNGNTVVAGKGILDFSQDMSIKTIANPIEKQSEISQINDPNKVTSGMIWDMNYVNCEIGGSQLGRNRRLTFGTPA